MPRPRKYTPEVLQPIVARCDSLTEVIRAFGLPPNGGNYRNIKAQIRRAGLDTSHFGSKVGQRLVAGISREALAPLVATSTSVAQVLVALGLPIDGRAHRELTARIKSLGLDTTHHRGGAWSRGETAATHPSVARTARRNSLPDAELFSANSSVVNNNTRLVKRLVELGWSYCCAICGISQWQGQDLVLHLDHINGIANDNRQINLRLLCPNCHSQTDTYCNRRRPEPSRASESRGLCYTSRTSRACRNW
jgi:hypothetical protein